METLDALSIVGIMITVFGTAASFMSLGLALAVRPCATCRSEKACDDVDKSAKPKA